MKIETVTDSDGVVMVEVDERGRKGKRIRRFGRVRRIKGRDKDDHEQHKQALLLKQRGLRAQEE